MTELEIQHKDLMTKCKEIIDSGDASPEAEAKFDELAGKAREVKRSLDFQNKKEQFNSDAKQFNRVVTGTPINIAFDSREVLRSWGADGKVNFAGNDQVRFLDNKLVYRSLNVGTDASGGFTVGESWNPVLEKLSTYTFDVAKAANVFVTDNDEDYHNPIMDDTGNNGEYKAEEGTISVNQDPTFSEVIHKSWDWYSPICKVSNRLLKNSKFDLAGELFEAFNGRFDRFVENAYVSTNAGSTAPEGMLYGVSAGVNLATGNAITLAKLQALEASVPYDALSLPGCAFLMHYKTWQAITQIVDGVSGRPLVNGDIQNGTEKRLFGYPVYISNKMTSFASPGDNQPLILFGNLKDYKIRNVSGVDLTRITELYAATGQTGFVAHRSYDARWMKKTLVATLNSYDAP